MVLAASFDWSCDFYIIAIVVAAMVSVGHLNRSPAILLGVYGNLVGKDDKCFSEGSLLVCLAFPSCPSVTMLDVGHSSLSFRSTYILYTLAFVVGVALHVGLLSASLWVSLLSMSSWVDDVFFVCFLSPGMSKQ